jgi:hypothetical protein
MSDIYDRKRQYEDQSKQLMKLCSIPERTTGEDLRRAATALRQASRDLDELMHTQPKGCSCTRHEDDGRSWVTYDNECQHHRHMREETQRMSDHYVQLEAKLKDELRLRLLPSALIAASRTESAAEVVADRAVAIVEAAIARLRK